MFVFASLCSCVCLPSVLGYFVSSLCVLSCVFLCFCICADVVALACQNVFERCNGLVYALICAGCSGSVFVCPSVVCIVFCCVFVYVLCLCLCFGSCACVRISF